MDELPAWKALPSTARAMLMQIELAAVDGAAKLTKYDFARAGIVGGNLVTSKARLSRLGFVEITSGAKRGANTYRLSDRWRELDFATAQKLVRVERRRPPRTVWLLRQLARAAKGGNAEALALWQDMTGRKRLVTPDPGIVMIGAERAYQLGRIKRERPGLFVKADGREKPKRPRRHFGDDQMVRRLQEGARARPGR